MQEQQEQEQQQQEQGRHAAVAVQTTFSVMTYNLWKTDGAPTFWETRRGE